jgi:polygalacturonase
LPRLSQIKIAAVHQFISVQRGHSYEYPLVRSSASAFKLGTASAGGFKDIQVRDIEVYDTYRSAIAIESVDGAEIEGIDIRNVTAKNTGNALADLSK